MEWKLKQEPLSCKVQFASKLHPHSEAQNYAVHQITCGPVEPSRISVCSCGTFWALVGQHSEVLKAVDMPSLEVNWMLILIDYSEVFLDGSALT